MEIRVSSQHEQMQLWNLSASIFLLLCLVKWRGQEGLATLVESCVVQPCPHNTIDMGTSMLCLMLLLMLVTLPCSAEVYWPTWQ